ncbi:mycothione reductase [Jatrophihabitans endophyticus]|uniref:Mycothione reductase n=1 Tax=Jatrophihabitans endophyticus TaxID=1206085 RepID=A0A1M5MW46_9ACTN|nr:mycothione reductase [Jatrophihabitans endophyticus]SHG81546.1 mycothione reductase [Jatrophihabitans endophyticus]
MTHYDLVIVGSGSGNSLVTPDFDDLSIAIVEEGVFGGTCLNVGCIPTKMYVYPADTAAKAAHAGRLGLQPASLRADWTAIRDRVFGRIDPISAGGREYRASGSPNVTLYEAHAEFTEPRTLRLSTGETITGDRIVLATGSRPLIPPPIADADVPFHTSDTVMRIPDLPERLVIVGAGYIAAEFAHVFTAFGTKVTVVSRSRLLRAMDEDITTRLTDLVRDDWDLRLGVDVTGISGTTGDLTVELSDGSQVRADDILVAAGRVPNSDRLGLDKAGVDVHDDGRIVVDEYQRTTADGVWALGDVSTEHQLKHVANQEARVVAHNLAHPDDLQRSRHDVVPAAVFTYPQLASVGLTEEQAQASGRRYVTVVQDYASVAYGWAMVDETSVCKLIADPSTGQLLGAHIMGEQASTLVQPIVQAMSFGLGVREMARDQYWIHPALTEVVENALLALELD